MNVDNDEEDEDNHPLPPTSKNDKVPPSVEVAAAAAKRPHDVVNEDAAAVEQASHQGALADARTSDWSFKRANGPTPVVRISNLMPGVTTKLLTNVFSKYGGLVGVHFRPDEGAAIVRFRTVDAAQRMWRENHGRRVVDKHMCVYFVHMATPPAGTALMEDADSADASTISTKEGGLPPRDSTRDGQQPRPAADDMDDTFKPEAAVRDKTRAAIDQARSFCDPNRHQRFDEMVADGATVAMLLLFAMRAQPGSKTAP